MKYNLLFICRMITFLQILKRLTQRYKMYNFNFFIKFYFSNAPKAKTWVFMANVSHLVFLFYELLLKCYNVYFEYESKSTIFKAFKAKSTVSKILPIYSNSLSECIHLSVSWWRKNYFLNSKLTIAFPK